MLYVNLLLIIVLVLLFIRSKGYRQGFYLDKDIDKKKHSLYFLYPLAEYLLTKTGLEKRLINKISINEKIRALYISDQEDLQIRLYWYRKVSFLLVIIFAFSSLSLITSIQDKSNNPKAFNSYLIRPEVGEGDEHLKLKFKVENERDQDLILEDEIIIRNKERIYTDKEWEEILDKAIHYLELAMLGTNEDAAHVDKNLNFIKTIPGTGINVEWEPKEYRLVSSKGEIYNNLLDNEKIETSVKAILTYGDRKVEHTIPITILPMKVSDKEILYHNLQDLLDKTEKDTETAKEWSLPRQLGDYRLTWQKSESNSAFIIIILGLLAAVFTWFYRDKELDNKIKLRNNQMLLDYPEIINKFNLLVNAGMTIKQAWIKISEDYKGKIDSDSNNMRYAYEEMLLTVHELKLGIPESNAYERFGKRAGLLPYMKFSSILVQNLKKGNRGMVDLLKRESMETFHERKERAKKIGEEASTKLLGPMLIMLVIVLIIIMIPAFISFSL